MSSSGGDPVSGGSLDLLGPTRPSDVTSGTVDAVPDAGRFDIPEPHRYRDGGLLGRGGMGEVRAAHDRRLGRLVALKVSREDRRRARGRVVGEAVLTAGLEHPGIVPVYGAGKTVEGRPFYTMPVVRGRSLAQAIESEPDLAGRLRLLRHFIDACQAVAYAHSRRVLHRDLKPSNIMVGEFGETIVVDWGLAVLMDRPVVEVRAAGTKEYAAPEQIAGLRLDLRADIYGLGATLYEILTGKAPRPATDGVESVTEPGVPLELVAIAEKARSSDPADRYDSAAELAADVEAWFEGRRVDAYEYSAWELVSRLVRAQRVPLAIALLAVLGIAAAVAVGFERTTLERDRALAAEEEAVQSRRRSEQNLRAALVAQAIESATRGKRGEAEILAANALLLGESLEARGILARFGGRPRPRRIAHWEFPDCSRATVQRGAGRLACATDDGVVLRSLSDPAKDLGRLDVEPFDVALESRSGRVVVSTGKPSVIRWDGETMEEVPTDRPRLVLTPHPRGDTMHAVSGGSGWMTVDEPFGLTQMTGCPPDGAGPRAMDLGVSGRVAMWCAGNGPGLVVAEHADAEAGAPLEPYDPALGIPLLVRLSEPDEALFVVATVGGAALVYDRATGRLRSAIELSRGVVGDLRVYGSRLAASSSEGDVEIWDLAGSHPIAHLPASGARLEWRDEGRTLRVIEDRAVSDWSVPDAARPHLLPSTSGIAAVDIAPDGRLVATAHGDGRVRVLDLDNGDLVHEVSLDPSVTKDVAFSPDGAYVAAAMAERTGLRVLEVADWTVRHLDADLPFRRLAWTGSTLIGAPYGVDLRAWTVGTEAVLRSVPVHGVFFEMDSTIDGRLVALEKSGAVVRVDDIAAGARAVGTSSGARALARTDDWVVIAEGRRLRIVGEGGERAFDFDGATVAEVAASPDGSLIAVGLLDGTIAVWSVAEGRRLALLLGHSARVAALDFDGSQWLVSGSWDGDTRVWNLESLRTPPPELARSAESDWGRDVARILVR